MNNKYMSQFLNSKLLAAIKSSKVYKYFDDKLNISQNFWWILGGIVGFIVFVVIATNVISYILDRPVAEEYTAEGVYIDPDGKHNVEYIQQRVKQIYSSSNSNNRKAYSSKGFYELYQKVQDANKDLRSLTGESGLELQPMNSEDGTINIQQLDFINPRCHRLAFAMFETSGTPMGYILRFERGDWYVDDIIHQNLTEKNACWQFLASHGQLKYLIGRTDWNGTWSNNDDKSFKITGFKMKDGAECNIKNVKIPGLHAFENKAIKGKIRIKDAIPSVCIDEDGIVMQLTSYDDIIELTYVLKDDSYTSGSDTFFKQ
jgi:hypothetical protein